MATCREIFTFTWPLRGRGGSTWPLFHIFFTPSLRIFESTFLDANISSLSSQALFIDSMTVIIMWQMYAIHCMVVNFKHGPPISPRLESSSPYTWHPMPWNMNCQGFRFLHYEQFGFQQSPSETWSPRFLFAATYRRGEYSGPLLWT